MRKSGLNLHKEALSQMKHTSFGNVKIKNFHCFIHSLSQKSLFGYFYFPLPTTSLLQLLCIKALYSFHQQQSMFCFPSFWQPIKSSPSLFFMQKPHSSRTNGECWSHESPIEQSRIKETSCRLRRCQRLHCFSGFRRMGSVRTVLSDVISCRFHLVLLTVCCNRSIRFS